MFRCNPALGGKESGLANLWGWGDRASCLLGLSSCLAWGGTGLWVPSCHRWTPPPIAAQRGTPHLQLNPLQRAGKGSGCIPRVLGDFSLLRSCRLRCLLCPVPPEHPSPASPAARSRCPLVPLALHCCTQRWAHCALAARSCRFTGLYRCIRAAGD